MLILSNSQTVCHGLIRTYSSFLDFRNICTRCKFIFMQGFIYIYELVAAPCLTWANPCTFQSIILATDMIRVSLSCAANSCHFHHNGCCICWLYVYSFNFDIIIMLLLPPTFTCYRIWQWTKCLLKHFIHCNLRSVAMRIIL